MNFFTRIFLRKDRISGPVVDLVEEWVIAPDADNQYVPSYMYGIYLHHSFQRVGTCDLRVGENEELYYAGNIGYRINPGYRGHHYAYEACRLLFDVAREKGMQELIITCSPENGASRKTIEKLGGAYLETTGVPSEHWLYQRGETVKRIYKYVLSAEAV